MEVLGRILLVLGAVLISVGVLSTTLSGSVEVKVVKYGDCEYVFYKNRGLFGQALSHKGDCSNVVHIYVDDTAEVKKVQ
jgi:hypothetical protein